MGRLQPRWRAVAVTFLILLGVLIARLSTSRDLVRVYEDEDKTRMSVLERIPPGTGVERAREIMERSRFKCVVEEGLYKPLPFTKRLHCRRFKGGWLSWISFNAEWRVSLWLGKDNSIDTVTVTYGFDGP